MLFSDDSACVRFFKDETCQIELAINNPYRAHIRSAGCDLNTVADAVIHYSVSDLVDGNYSEREAVLDFPCTAILFDKPLSARWACFGKHARKIARANLAKTMN
jgi:hypothetical protein